jgi:hypothetical protein
VLFTTWDVHSLAFESVALYICRPNYPWLLFEINWGGTRVKSNPKRQPGGVWQIVGNSNTVTLFKSTCYTLTLMKKQS